MTTFHMNFFSHITLDQPSVIFYLTYMYLPSNNLNNDLLQIKTLKMFCQDLTESCGPTNKTGIHE